MSFTSLEFIFIFFPLCVAGYYLMPGRFRNMFLLAASLVFYAAGEPDRMYILIAGILANYCFGLVIGKCARRAVLKKAVLILSLVLNFGILFGYKYLLYKYGASSITLPLGLSFFTFRTVSYCLDVYWDMTPANRNLFEVALYISFFPQISMGPVSRYADFLRQMYERSFDADVFSNGIRRIITGLFKKLVIADTLIPAVNACFGMDPSLRSVSFAWLGLIAYLIQLYYDFMGYTDIAIGLGSLFGFELPENFDYPYAASSATDFWNRWHMTLGIWIKNYIYIPIFRSCQSRKMTTLKCYLLASLGGWLFSGIWHGVGIKTVCFGLYYFILIAGERLYDDRKRAWRRKHGIKHKKKTLSSIITSHIYFTFAILFGQLLFKCDSLEQFITYIGSMFMTMGNPLSQAETVFYLRQSMLPLLVGFVFAMPVIPYVKKKIKDTSLEKLAGYASPVLYFAMFIISLAFAFTSTYKSFVYFQF